jgi:hypothetical protein
VAQKLPFFMSNKRFASVSKFRHATGKAGKREVLYLIDYNAFIPNHAVERVH